jgi:internalin A
MPQERQPEPKMNDKEKAAYDSALRMIEGNQEKKLPLLMLTKMGLTKIPAEIGTLSHLTHLTLAENQLTEFPLEIGQLKALTKLSLSNNQLTSLPPEIGQLTSLTDLVLSDNQLRSVPPEICQLTGLIQLDLSDNQLRSLPPEIGQLTALTRLCLSSNKLDTLPPQIGRLSALTELVLTHNLLSSLPSEFSRLTALTQLGLSHNAFTTLPIEITRLTSLTLISIGWNQISKLPPEIAQLSKLIHLNLDSNRLSQLPDGIGSLTSLAELFLSKNRLRVLPAEILKISRLTQLFLHGNPNLGIPPEVLGPTWMQVYLSEKTSCALPRTILDYYFSKRTQTTRPLNEVKLILVGRGGAGKTSTVKALRSQNFDDSEDSTAGIALSDWTMDGCKKAPVTAHVWDFSGQVITHALHQFFFSVRSVYLVVLTGRENCERDDAEYWLRLIKAFGTDEAGQGPPVLIALNKWDVPGCRPKVDRGALQERYPFVRGFVEMDCKTKKGVTKLTTALCREVDRLQWVREPFPEVWDDVRRALAGRSKKAHLTYAEFRALCADHGLANAGEQDSLAEILHNLGAALNYRNDPRLREATVLKPQWLTKNVYALIRRAEKCAGVLSRENAESVLRAEKDPKMRDYLIRLMERFEIAYPAKASGSGVWLVPQALPDVQPKGAETFRDASDATRLRYTYQALPEGLVARAIVRLHEFIEEKSGKRLQWASGAILVREGARALIRTEPQDRRVMITVIGPKKARQQLAGLCQSEMRDIHAEIPGLDPNEETQVGDDWVSTATLEGDEKTQQLTGIPTKGGTRLIDPTGPNNAYSEKSARTDEVLKPTVFISYSKSNVAQRKRLESELKILKNEGLLNRHWHDRMIDPGDEWDPKIQRELEEADVIIILASSAALSTDYITKHEIPKAIELHQGKMAVVVPIILEACRWSETALGALNALPEKAKPLNKWRPSSDGWKSVADGLATILKKLTEESSATMTKIRTRPHPRATRVFVEHFGER